jgi:S-DNA-T family DNA segregation ATPase FtsK/SpoIIIE
VQGSGTSPAAGQRGSGRAPRDDALIYGPLAVLVLALLAFAGYGLKVPGAPWAGGVAAIAIAGCVAARLRNGATAVSLWWFIAISLSAVWLGWTRFLNIRLVVVWLPLAVGAIGFGITYPRVCNRHAQRVEEAARRAEEAERIARELAIKNHWPMLLERIGHPGVKIVGREETASGYVLALRLPSSGRVTITKLRGDVERLEVAADTRRGSLYFEEGATARDVRLHVTERDFLAETIPYEDNGEVLSIHNPIPIGRYEDGTICELTLREIAVLIVGLRGSGKSNLANVFIAQLARCVDVLVFCIDMKYRLAMPWVAPYLEDERNGMAVDWAATDRSEAERMLRAFVRGIGARAAAGEGEEKIEPEPERPAVFLVIDEIASIFGVGTGPKPSSNQATNTTLAALGTDAVRLGRSEAMDLIAVSQRGNVSMLGTGDFKSQFPLRIGLSVQNETEALSVIPDDKRAAKILASLKHEGTGLVQWREGRMMRVKFFRITPAQVGEIARRYGPMKPRPEPVLAEALGKDYVTRWERFRATRKAAVSATRAGRGNPTDRQFREITSRLGDVEDAAQDDGLSAPRRRMREYIGRSADRGVTVAMIVNLLDSEHMAADEHTVRRWLSDDIDRSVIEQTPRGSYRLRSAGE